MLKKIRTSLDLTLDELMNKTTWPTWEELQSSALVTLISALIIALLIFGVDSIFENLFRLFYQMTK